MTSSLNVFLLITTFTACSATAITCDADLTTKFAIGKRELEKQLECRIDKTQQRKCTNVSAVDAAWREFEKVNDEYAEKIAQCKISQKPKRAVCDCSDGMHMRERRGCGCAPQRDSHSGRNDNLEGAVGNSRYDDEVRVRRSTKVRCHKHDSSDGCDGADYDHRERRQAHDPNDGGDHTGHDHRIKRHDHGSNDDNCEEEAVPEANDRSKEFQSQEIRTVRNRRGNCIDEGKKEVSRLQKKYGALCDLSKICDKQNLQGEAKASMDELSKRRMRKYREYISSFDLCYGSVV